MPPTTTGACWTCCWRPATKDSDAGLTDAEVRDEAVTLLLAGHETTAVALSWTWPLVAAHPEVEARLWAEVDALDGPPGFDDLGRLPTTRQVFAEAMRLYPPAWVIGRQAARDLDLDGVPVAQGSTILIPPLWIHRDPRFWADPERFDPDRFAPDQKAGRHKFAYLPFSAGRRGCIGEQFAWAEGVLVLAALAQRWRIRPAGPLPPPVGSVTLPAVRPDPGPRRAPLTSADRDDARSPAGAGCGRLGPRPDPGSRCASHVPTPRAARRLSPGDGRLRPALRRR